MADTFQFDTGRMDVPILAFETPKIKVRRIARFLIGIVREFAIRPFAAEIKRQLHIAVDWLFDQAAANRDDAHRLVDRLIDNAVEQV